MTLSMLPGFERHNDVDIISLDRLGITGQGVRVSLLEYSDQDPGTDLCFAVDSSSDLCCDPSFELPLSLAYSNLFPILIPVYLSDSCIPNSVSDLSLNAAADLKVILCSRSETSRLFSWQLRFYYVFNTELLTLIGQIISVLC